MQCSDIDLQKARRNRYDQLNTAYHNDKTHDHDMIRKTMELTASKAA